MAGGDGGERNMARYSRWNRPRKPVVKKTPITAEQRKARRIERKLWEQAKPLTKGPDYPPGTRPLPAGAIVRWWGRQGSAFVQIGVGLYGALEGVIVGVRAHPEGARNPSVYWYRVDLGFGKTAEIGEFDVAMAWERPERRPGPAEVAVS